jgi:hypothetical protein
MVLQYRNFAPTPQPHSPIRNPDGQFRFGAVGQERVNRGACGKKKQGTLLESMSSFKNPNILRSAGVLDNTYDHRF